MNNLDSTGFEVPNGAAGQPAYNAGGLGRRLRNWRPTSAGPNAVATQSIDTIRARSRSAHRNDPWAGTATDKIVSNGIGTGIQAKSVNGTPEQQAVRKKLWDRWIKVADADGVLDFYGLQALAWREWDEAGEVFIRLRPRRLTDGLPVPLQLQLLEAEQCPAQYYGIAPGTGNPIRAGIEFSVIGRRVAYWMYRNHPGDIYPSGQSNELVRIPAEQILHLYEPTRAGQLRGIPRSAPVLVRMYNLDQFDDAVLERQKVGNLFAGFFETPENDANAATGFLSEAQKATQAASGPGSDIDVDGTPLPGLEPGTMGELPPGWKATFTNPPDAGSNYSEYLRSQLLAIAAKHGVPYEVLTGDLRDVSDRALKLILNEFRRLIEQLQWLYLIPQFLQPVRAAFFDAALLAGVLDLPDYADLRDEYAETVWVPQGWPYSHPVQDVDADIKAVQAGFTSRDAVVLANGEDPEQMDDQIARSNERADRLGAKFTSDGRYATQKSGAAPAQRPAQEGTDEPQ